MSEVEQKERPSLYAVHLSWQKILGNWLAWQLLSAGFQPASTEQQSRADAARMAALPGKSQLVK